MGPSAEDTRTHELVARAARRRQLMIMIVAGVVSALSVAGVFFMWFMAALMTFGLDSSQPPEVDPGVWLPVLGAGLLLALGPLTLSLGEHPRRWRIVAVVAAAVGVIGLSAITWIPAALGLAR